LDKIFVQDTRSGELLENIGVNYIMGGDTRFDRVQSLSANRAPDLAAASFTEGHTTIIAGSSWQEEENLLKNVLANKYDLRIIIAPHDISEKHLKYIETLFVNEIIRYSVY